ncbi:unnamed protein product [Cylicostephanus goldi]|uniref:ATP-dependent DNA helicase n=1 Tax=Cylicostephanus goldi TaxID=71465 RepID=A0A3P7LSW1_CYLGO|nr:unnamed protein product [Cylicostephanus goldi]
MVFVYGKAGCGKTFTFNVLIHELEKRNLSIIAVASTGIAATLLENENRGQPFGGCEGFWRGLVPVSTRIPGASKMDTINESFKASYVWNELEVYVLDEDMRLCAGVDSHAAWLRAVGEGTNLIVNGMEVEIPIKMCMESEDEVISCMYTEDIVANPKLVGSLALLTVRIADALELNEVVLKMAPEKL